MLRTCDTCKTIFEYFPPEGTTRLKIYCDDCMQIRRASHNKSVDGKPTYCKMCFKKLKKVGAETCGNACSAELSARRLRGDGPIEGELYKDLQKGFTYDEPSVYV